jgi:hypothetical protein
MVRGMLTTVHNTLRSQELFRYSKTNPGYHVANLYFAVV